jgi:hypothetical protein
MWSRGVIDGALADRRVSNVSRRYDISGVALTISGDAAPLAALDDRFGGCHIGTAGSATISFEFQNVTGIESHSPSQSSTNWRPVYDTEQGEVLYDPGNDRLRITFDKRVEVTCDPAAGTTLVSVRNPKPADDWLLSHPIITLPLLENLKRLGLYSLHAAGLTWRDRGLLLAGGSGSGKSTLAITLARAGFGFLGDDMLFLSTDGARVGVRGFPDQVDVTDSTVRFFPELQPMLECPRPDGWPKRSFRIEAIYGESIVSSCIPAAIVFPRVANADNSTLTPMRPDEALLELAPNVLLTEPRACQAHLHALARLTMETPCYRLWTGRDFDAIPAIVGALV